MKEALKRLNIRILKWADTNWGVWALFFFAFADSALLGLPTPVLFMALALLNIKKAYIYALFATLGTLAGSIAGYSIGHFAWLDLNGGFTRLAQFLLNNIPGFSESGYNNIHLLFEKWDLWILFVTSALPLPIFSISSGVFDINIFIFCFATIISQGIKFFLLAILTIKFGQEVNNLLKVNWKPVAIIAAICGLATIVFLRVL